METNWKCLLVVAISSGFEATLAASVQIPLLTVGSAEIHHSQNRFGILRPNLIRV